MAETILITGAGGFIGRAVADRLAEGGAAVRAVSRQPVGLPPGFSEIAAMPQPGAGPEAWAPLLDGVTHVVHCAGIADTSTDPAAYEAANARLTGELAQAAARRIPGKVVFLSSIRAVCGSAFAGTVTEETEPVPQDPYGRSKIEGERLVRAAFAASGRFTILRPVPVYGPGVKGNLGALLRLARLPVPLPLAKLSARRSLLDLDACAAGVAHALASPSTDGRSFVVSDRNAVSTPEIIAAFRRGLGRRPGLFALPPGLLSLLAGLAGQADILRRLGEPLVADPSAFAETGWRPAESSVAGLERLAARSR